MSLSIDQNPRSIAFRRRILPACSNPKVAQAAGRSVRFFHVLPERRRRSQARGQRMRQLHQFAVGFADVFVEASSKAHAASQEIWESEQICLPLVTADGADEGVPRSVARGVRCHVMSYFGRRCRHGSWSQMTSWTALRLAAGRSAGTKRMVSTRLLSMMLSFWRCWSTEC